MKTVLPLPKKLHYRLLWMALSEAVRNIEYVNVPQDALVFHLNGDEWTSGFYASTTQDPLQARVVLICRKNQMSDRSNVTTYQHEIPLETLFKEWSVSLEDEKVSTAQDAKPRKKTKTKV